MRLGLRREAPAPPPQFTPEEIRQSQMWGSGSPAADREWYHAEGLKRVQDSLDTLGLIKPEYRRKLTHEEHVYISTGDVGPDAEARYEAMQREPWDREPEPTTPGRHEGLAGRLTKRSARKAGGVALASPTRSKYR